MTAPYGLQVKVKMFFWGAIFTSPFILMVAGPAYSEWRTWQCEQRTNLSEETSPDRRWTVTAVHITRFERYAYLDSRGQRVKAVFEEGSQHPVVGDPWTLSCYCEFGGHPALRLHQRIAN